MAVIGEDAIGGAPLGEHLLGTVALLQEGIVMSDVFPAFIVGIDDGLVLSDAPAPVLNVPIADNVIVHDRKTLPFLLGARYLGDWAVDITVVDAIAEGLVLSDAHVDALDVPMDDYLSLGDAPAPALNVPIAEGLVLSDAPAPALNVPLDEGLVLSDAPAPALNVPIDEGLVLSDVAVESVLAEIADGLVLSDAASELVTPGRLVEVQPESESAAPDVDVYLVQYDSLPNLLFVFTDRDGEFVDYGSGASVRLRMRKPGAGSYTIDALCSRLPNGWWRYALQSGDTNVAGEYEAELIVTIGTRELTSEMFTVRIRAVLTAETATPEVPAPDPTTPSITIGLTPEAESAIQDVVVHLAEGDTLPYLTFQLRDHSGETLQLNVDDTMILRLWARDGTTYLINALCTRLDDGRYLYALLNVDTNTSGEYYAHVVVVDVLGRTYTSEVFIVRIREDV